MRQPIGELTPAVDLALEIYDGRRWCGTKQQVRVELGKVGELVSVLERAVGKPGSETMLATVKQL